MDPFDFAQGRLPHHKRIFLNPLALSASKGLK